MKRRKLRSISIAVLCTFNALTGCADADRPAADRSTTLTILYQSGADHWLLTPWSNLSSQQMVYSPLFQSDENMDPGPHLVRAWEHSEDFREWTYHLRTDVRWHDGAPLTAHDVKFTYDLYGHPAVTRLNPEAHTITVLDDSTFTSTRHLHSGLFIDTWRGILPRHRLEELDPETLDQWEEWEHPIGTGPYRFLRHVRGSGIELEANPDYFLGKPEIERVFLQFGGQPWVEMQSENVDVAAEGISKPEMLELAEDPRFEVYWRMTGANMGSLWCNHRHPILGDVRVRRALIHAVDPAPMAAISNQPPGLPTVHFPATAAQILRGEYPEPFSYDPEMAMDLLEQAGWRDEDGDGIRERNGEELRFGILITGESEPNAILLQDQYRRVGVAMEIETVAMGLLINRLFEGSFEAAMGGAGGGRFFRILMGEEGSPGAGYQSPEMERILAERDASFDPLAEEKANRAMWPIIARDLPTCSVGGVGFRMSIANKRVKGLRAPDRIFPDRHAAHLWIEEGG
jgi:peptide/nickel transport system substrate-binding protein